MSRVLNGLVAVTLGLSQVGCQPSHPSVEETSRDAIRMALHAAWRAYTLQSPSAQETLPSGLTQAAGKVSVGRFEAEGKSSIASLDSALTAIPPAGEPHSRYLRETLAGLVSTLRDRHNAELITLEAIRGEEQGVHVDEETGTRILRAAAVADGVAERSILRLAAWERRFLHESYLADSYEGRLLAMVENTRANGVPDSMLLHRPEIDERITRADSIVVAEISHIK